MVKKLEVLSAKFNTYHCTIVDQIEDQNKLTWREGSSRQLWRQGRGSDGKSRGPEPVMAHASGMDDHRPVRLITEVEHLSWRLSQVYDSLTKVKRVVEEKETDMCLLLEGHEETLKCIKADLQGIKQDLLLIDDYESLAGKAVGLEEASFELQVTIKRLLVHQDRLYSK